MHVVVNWQSMSILYYNQQHYADVAIDLFQRTKQTCYICSKQCLTKDPDMLQGQVAKLIYFSTTTKKVYRVQLPI